ncbi:MAG: inositol monophosphatase family protein, partial [Patescibacteria group bacterium]
MAFDLPHYQNVVPILKEAGEMLRASFGNVNVEAVQYKSAIPADAVTDLDRRAEKFIAERLAAYDPSIAFFGEEYGGNEQAERYWLLDPIDGTGHYIRGNPFCTTMLALIESGQVTFSAIFDFVREEMFAAARGQGAFRNEERIHVSKRPLSQAYIAFEANLKHESTLSKWLELQKHCIVLTNINCGFEFT